MDLFIVIEEKINIPVAIFDDFYKAKQYMHCMPSKHLYIYQYRLNELNTEKKISDSYFIHGI